MAYVKFPNGLGQTDAPTWGYISPCGAAQTGAGSPSPAATNANSTLTLAGIGVGLLILFGVFEKGGRG